VGESVKAEMTNAKKETKGKAYALVNTTEDET